LGVLGAAGQRLHAAGHQLAQRRIGGARRGEVLHRDGADSTVFKDLGGERSLLI
jgi:hypothetical protein